MSREQRRKRTVPKRTMYSEERNVDKDDTTLDYTLVPAPSESGIYRKVVRGPGDDYMVHRKRPEHPGGPVKGATTLAGKTSRVMPLLAFIHLTDLHVTDVQSPARAEFLDRLGDSDSPLFDLLGNVGTYRPQDMLTVQVLEAMVRKAGKMTHGPVTACPVSFVMVTGDAIDNSQYNELKWYMDVLKGGVAVTPDSGDYSRYEGVGSEEFYDEHYWQPAPQAIPATPPIPTRADIPHDRYGFPDVPELLEACRRPFASEGLGMPCYTVAGNHDVMLAGTVPHDDLLRRQAVSSRKYTGWAEGVDIGALLTNHDVDPPDVSSALAGGPWKKVTSDPDRHLIGEAEWKVVSSLSQVPSPFYPLPIPSVAPSAAPHSYYAFDVGIVRFLVLDTVNRSGGWQGSLDREQLSWLNDELVAGHGRILDSAGHAKVTGNGDRLFVLCSHHPFDTLVNGYTGGKYIAGVGDQKSILPEANLSSAEGDAANLRDNKGRVLSDDLGALLARFPNIVLWLNGHTHRHRIKLLQLPGANYGIWEITTSSLIDWPQQGRVIELAINFKSGQLVVYSTVFDHDGVVDPGADSLDDPMVLAGLSRELSANSWHHDIHTLDLAGRGMPSDRNAILHIPLPFPISPE